VHQPGRHRRPAPAAGTGGRHRRQAPAAGIGGRHGTRTDAETLEYCENFPDIVSVKIVRWICTGEKKGKNG
jgi:hypothetical protein